jgi:predicted DCC family thiol-disulfide oxidoreductase YuxK
VRLLLRLDRAGRLRFAPLGGETFRALLGEGARSQLPDSLLLRTADGRLLVRSAAVLESLRRTGGLARGLAAIAGTVPPGLADRLYDFVARVRGRFFAAPTSTCPVVGRADRRLLP